MGGEPHQGAARVWEEAAALALEAGRAEGPHFLHRGPGTLGGRTWFRGGSVRLWGRWWWSNELGQPLWEQFGDFKNAHIL